MQVSSSLYSRYAQAIERSQSDLLSNILLCHTECTQGSPEYLLINRCELACHGSMTSCVIALTDNVEQLAPVFHLTCLTDKYVNLDPESVSSFS